jgi:hypothetical protein
MAIVCCIFAAPVPGLAADGMRPMVVASDLHGNSNFSMVNRDGTLTAQQIEFDRQMLSDVYGVTTDDWTYSNGVGDFDNDGTLDFILAIGNDVGTVYLFGKIENNEFVPQSDTTVWSRGKYPGKMAVADFNEDGNLDFIMTYDGSVDCDLYLGDGNLEFTAVELRDTAPYKSIAADVGDFNGDGHADFVAVTYDPLYSGQAYINYGDGTGKFTKSIQYLGIPSNSVAAADFTGDGKDDLAVFYYHLYVSYIYIYSSSSNGYFSYINYILDWNMHLSPLDAYDVNGDGHQDLVVGGYWNPDSGTYTDIAVMLGKGNGTFHTAVAYGGAPEGLDQITSISAPTPFQPENPNAPPVADISCESPEVSAGQTVYLDGLGSYDDDGEIVSYLWDFGDGTRSDGLEAANASGYEAEHVYYEAGEYTITLTVIDDQGAEGKAEYTVTVSAVAAGIKISPRVLSLKSRGRWMHAWVNLPEGCDAAQVGVDSIEVSAGSSPPQPIALANGSGMAVISRKWMARKNKFYIKFDRQATIDAVSAASDQTTIRINGAAFCNDGYAEFGGEDTIRTITKEKKPHKKKHKKMKSWSRRGRR